MGVAWVAHRRVALGGHQVQRHWGSILQIQPQMQTVGLFNLVLHFHAFSCIFNGTISLLEGDSASLLAKDECHCRRILQRQ